MAAVLPDHIDNGDEIGSVSPANLSENDILRELGESYAEYMKVDISKERRLVEEATEELLTKLEEFLSLADLVRSDSSLCLTTTLPKIHKKYQDLQVVLLNIDKLEAFINVVKKNVETLEARIVDAEKIFLPDISFSKLLKPLFSKKETPAKNDDTVELYSPPEIFQTSQYFVHQDSVPEAKSSLEQ